MPCQVQQFLFEHPFRKAVTLCDVDPAALVMFAERFDIPSVITGAMYKLSRARCTRELTEDRTTGPGPWYNTIQPSLTRREQVARTTNRSARWSLLSAKYLLALGRLKEEIEDAMGGLIDNPVALDFGTNSHCSNKAADEMSFKKLMEDLKREFSVERDSLKALQNCRGKKLFGPSPNDLCNYCTHELETQVSRRREEIWMLAVKSASKYRHSCLHGSH